jgi:hypothetical protein
MSRTCLLALAWTSACAAKPIDDTDGADDSDTQPSNPDLTITAGDAPTTDVELGGFGRMKLSLNVGTGAFGGFAAQADFLEPDTYSLPDFPLDTCFTEFVVYPPRGWKSMGNSVQLGVGASNFDMAFMGEGAEYAYADTTGFEPPVDAAISLLGTSMDVSVPESPGPLALPLLDTLADTGVLALTWSGSGGDYVDVHLLGSFGGPLQPVISCRLVDDGVATLITAPATYSVASLFVTRVRAGAAEASGVGTVSMIVSSESQAFEAR